MANDRLQRRTYGQYFTPEAVVACCYQLLDRVLARHPRVADPACGDGVFLRYATTCGLAECADVYGCEIDPAYVAALQTDGFEHVYCTDGLGAALERESFDLVVGNPPFGIALTAEQRRWPPSEVRFLLQALEIARPGGHIALVVPNGVLANRRLRDLRAMLLASCTILAVVALPRTTFHHTGTRASCSILVLRRAPPQSGHQIFFANAPTTDALPAVVASFHKQPLSTPARQPETYWLAQTDSLAHRLDAGYWSPAYTRLIAHMQQRHMLRPLGELIGRQAVIVGDHVRPSLGEMRGRGLPYEYYQTREFLAAGYNYAAIDGCNERAYRRLKRTAVEQHDILVSCAGVGGAGNGRVCLVTHRPQLSCTGDIITLRVREPNPIFLFLFLASRAGRQQLLRLQNGVGTVNLNADELLEVLVPLVDPALQHNLARCYEPIAAAHHRAMAAAVRQQQSAFQLHQVESEALLRHLLSVVEATICGDAERFL